jgi:uncharacterized protein YihD (DUF1040 family)
MRDPKRMPEILELIGKLWSYYPDLRLGQLLQNFVFPSKMMFDTEMRTWNDCAFIFQQEDDTTITKLKDAIQKYESTHKCKVCPPWKYNACNSVDKDRI